MFPSLITGSTPFKNRFSNPPVLINPDGVGNYDNFTDALAASPAGTIFVIEGSLTENITIAKSCKLYGLPGAQINGELQVDGGDVEVYDLAFIDDHSHAVIADGLDITFRAWNCEFIANGAVGFILGSDNGGSVLAEFFGPGKIYSGDLGGPVGLQVGGNEAASIILRMYGGFMVDIVQGAFGNAVSFVSTSIDGPNSHIQGAHINGDNESFTASVAVTLSCYLSLLKGAVNANVTLPAGGNNVLI